MHQIPLASAVATLVIAPFYEQIVESVAYTINLTHAFVALPSGPPLLLAVGAVGLALMGTAVATFPSGNRTR